MSKNELVIPPLKWAGGKRQLLPEIRKMIPKKFGHYYEPFLGGGAVLFDIQPKTAFVNDFNSELINFYETIRDSSGDVISLLSGYENTKEFYYRIREIDRDLEKFLSLSRIERAARVHYLNKTCYNGLFRVNSVGQFNAPFGFYKNPNMTNDIVITAVGKYLSENNIHFSTGDFEEALKGAKKDDFVYLDPPYDDLGDDTSFTGYTKTGFSKEDQKRLKKVCDELNDRGVMFLLSNSSTDFVNELYSGYTIRRITARRNINSIGDERGAIDEVLVSNYDQTNKE
jgi:DNA adenine methylase